MVEIVNQQGLVLELDDNAAIPVERNNMLFNDSDTLFQDVVYSFGAPLSPANKLFIAQAYLVDADIALYKINVQVFLGAFNLFKCVMDFSIKNGKIEITLKPNFAAKAKKAGESSLNQIDVNDQLSDMSGTTMAGHMNDTINSPQDYNYIFTPLYSPNYFPTAVGSPTSFPYINQYSGFFTGFDGNGGIIQFPKVLSILKILGKVLGFNTLKGDWQTTDQALKSYIFNLRNVIGSDSFPYSTLPIGLCLPKMTIAE
ncbi:MAG: hypothetical protein H7202_13040, partial [Pedobacter sp.]|nr:hypothetical protein [Pedobacter sp.]